MTLSGLKGRKVLGTILTFDVARLIEELLPSFVVTLRPPEVMLVALASLVTSTAATLLPLSRVTRLDPASAPRPA